MREVIALEKQRRELPANAEQARTRWGEQQRAAKERAAYPSHHAEAYPGATVEARNAARFNFLAGVLPDGGDRRTASRSDALLHDAQRSRGTPVGLLVAAVHPRALPDGAGLRRVREVRDLHESGQYRDHAPAWLDRGLGQALA